MGMNLAGERADFLGIVKPDSLQKWLENTPIKNELAESLVMDRNHCEDIER